MKIHANAKLGPKGRLVMCRRVSEEGWSLTEAAEAAGVSERTCRKWVQRYLAEGELGLEDRSSAPRSVPHRTPEERVELIAALRRVRFTGAEIALTLDMALSTVSAVLGRIGLGKLSHLEPLEPPNRYERARPGELVHIDVKKLGRIKHVGHRVTGSRRKANRHRGAGWEFVHVCVDDATRLAYVEVLGDEKATTAIGFLKRALAFYAAHGVTVERLMTDNGSAYRSTMHAIACRTLRIRHIRTRPYRPRTNGKAERFIRTLLGSVAERDAEIRRLVERDEEIARLRVRQVEADEGLRLDLPTSEEREEIKQLRREVYELRRANEILKAASVFFATELDADRSR